MFQHTEIFFGDVFLPSSDYKCFVLRCGSVIKEMLLLGCVFFLVFLFLFYSASVTTPETRGLSLMHRDNIGGNIDGKLFSCTQKQKIEKFIFNGHKASLRLALPLWSYENIRCLQQNYKHLFFFFFLSAAIRFYLHNWNVLQRNLKVYTYFTQQKGETKRKLLEYSWNE